MHNIYLVPSLEPQHHYGYLVIQARQMLIIAFLVVGLLYLLWWGRKIAKYDQTRKQIISVDL